jgi:PEP-CTERM motif-containing protein
MKIFSRLLGVCVAFCAAAATAKATIYADTYWDFGSNPKHLSTNVTGGVMSPGNFDALFTPVMNDMGNPSSGYTGFNGPASGVHNAVVETQNFAGPVTNLLDANNPTATYFEFTLTPNAGLQLSATDFELGSRGKTGFGPTTLTLAASIDGFASDITILGTTTLVANNSWALYNLASFSYSAPIDTPVTFRIYGTDGTGGLGSSNWRIDDVTLQLVAVPEPATWALLCVGVLFGGTRALRRRKFAVA